MLRCPKLTRYKLVSGFILSAFSVFLMMNTVTRLNEVHFMDGNKEFTFFSLTSCGPKGNIVCFSQENDTGEFARSDLGFNIIDKTIDDNDSGSQAVTGGLQKRLPSAIVIGARKAGTRALLRFINLHSDVAASRQETHFFDRNYDHGLDWYRHQMPYSSENQVTVEKTPNYFVDWDVPERIYNFNSSIKLILIVRNPVDRAVSDYVQLKEKFYKSGHNEYFGRFEDLAFNRFTGDINKSYAPIKRSLYCRHLDKWLTYFQLSQLLMIDGENIKVRPWEEIYKLETFLGLSHQIGKDRFVYNETKGFYCVKLEKAKELPQSDDQSTDYFPWSEQCLADSKGRNHPILQPDVRQQLLNFFQPFNTRFFTKIGQTFNWT